MYSRKNASYFYRCLLEVFY